MPFSGRDAFEQELLDEALRGMTDRHATAADWRVRAVKRSPKKTLSPTDVQTLTALVLLPVEAFFAMLALGGLHDEASEGVPALSYWASLGVVYLFGILSGPFKRG